MASHASAEKRNRQRVKRTERNRSTKSQLRTAVKKARTALKGAAQDVATQITAAVSALDRAASKGRIPDRRASVSYTHLTLPTN